MDGRNLNEWVYGDVAAQMLRVGEWALERARQRGDLEHRISGYGYEYRIGNLFDVMAERRAWWVRAERAQRQAETGRRRERAAHPTLDLGLE
jgi:hypothetical protein